jgi:hypothetical protein
MTLTQIFVCDADQLPVFIILAYTYSKLYLHAKFNVFCCSCVDSETCQILDFEAVSEAPTEGV